MSTALISTDPRGLLDALEADQDLIRVRKDVGPRFERAAVTKHIRQTSNLPVMVVSDSWWKFGFGAAPASHGHRLMQRGQGLRRPRGFRDAVRLVRQAVGPETAVRADANMAWRSTEQAIRNLGAIEPYEPEPTARPLPPQEPDALAPIRTHVDGPIMRDESVRTPRDVMAVTRRAAAGIPCGIGSMPEFGSGPAAQIHLGVVMTDLGLDSDTCGVLCHAEDLLTEPVRIENGLADAPPGPGIGVDMDVAARRRNPPQTSNSNS